MSSLYVEESGEVDTEMSIWKGGSNVHNLQIGQIYVK